MRCRCDNSDNRGDCKPQKRFFHISQALSIIFLSGCAPASNVSEATLPQKKTDSTKVAARLRKSRAQCRLFKIIPTEVADIPATPFRISSQKSPCCLTSRARVKLIALTGRVSEDEKKAALKAGFDAHLSKPVDMCLLNAILASDPRSR